MSIRPFIATGAATAALLTAMPAQAERGADGELRLMLSQAPTQMNAYLTAGLKDQLTASLIVEPLASFDAQGNIVPRLAAEVPTLENGGVAEDLTSMTWTLKDGITWSDGTPFTAEDVKFTADYCMDPEGGCSMLQKYDGIASVEVVDPLTVKVIFDSPRPYPYAAFVGMLSPIIQKAQFEPCRGSRAPSCTEQNFAPIGTGPFRITEFRPGDVAIFEANPEYRDPDKPHFSSVTVKGGSDSTATARAVLETGEFDYGWNIQIAPELMADMTAKGLGTFEVAFGNLVEMIYLNTTDPSPSLPEGERATATHPHPFLQDPAVRKALSMAIDRKLLTEIGYGETGRPTCDIVPNPAIYAAGNTGCLTQDIAGANALLDEAGWTHGADGVRAKDGVRLSMLYQTSVNPVRQDFQALIKQWWSEIGIGTQLKTVDPSVYFGGDPASPDTFQKFYADVEMHASLGDGTDPGTYLARNQCSEAPSPENQWQGQNTGRFCSDDYDALVTRMSQTAEIEQRGELAKKLDTLIAADSNWILPLIARGRVSARSNTLTNYEMNTWDSEFWNIAEWRRAQ